MGFKKMLGKKQKKEKDESIIQNNGNVNLNNSNPNQMNIGMQQNQINMGMQPNQMNMGMQQNQMNMGMQQNQMNMGMQPNQANTAVNNQNTSTENPNQPANFNGLPSNKSKKPNKKIVPKKSFRYVVINSMNKKEKGTFDAETEEEIRIFFQSQDYKVLEIKERSKGDVDIQFGNKIKAGDLSFALTQLSTYIKAGIPLIDSVKILSKQTSKANLKKSYNQIVYELLRGESLSDAMAAQGDFYPQLLINMIQTSELTGDLPSILDDMSEYYTSMDQTKKQMSGAMVYPVVVLTIAFGVLIFMITYLVPQFTTMFENNDATLPAITLAVLGLSDFVKKYWLHLIIGAGAFIGIFVYAYKHVRKFREMIQIILMHLPIIKNIIIYNEISNFTKTFASLINHGVFITDSMEILSKITNNEVYKRIINKTMTNLANGDTISMAFKGEWAIPVVAYEMLVTGETTGQLGLMMEKVSSHFQMMHKNVIDQMKSLIEPMLIIFLAGIVGVILLSIIQPMFSIYDQVK